MVKSFEEWENNKKKIEESTSSGKQIVKSSVVKVEKPKLFVKEHKNIFRRTWDFFFGWNIVDYPMYTSDDVYPSSNVYGGGFDSEKKNRVSCSSCTVSDAIIDKNAYSRMLNLAKLSANIKNTECGGILIGDGYRINRVTFPEQKTTGAGYEFSSEIAAATKFGQGEKFMGWWHSHNHMQTFLSPTDTDNISRILLTSPKMYSIVVNAKGDIRCWCSMRLPCKQVVTGEVLVRVEIQPDLIEFENQRKEVLENVNPQTFLGIDFPRWERNW